MQNLLKPQFVGLMDDDEKKFVVTRRIRERFLKLYQFRNFEIFIVRKCGVFPVFFGHLTVVELV